MAVVRRDVRPADPTGATSVRTAQRAANPNLRRVLGAPVVDLGHDLRAVTREIRPDWDLAAPGLREAWNAGDYSRFHGWDKRAAVAPSAP